MNENETAAERLERIGDEAYENRDAPLQPGAKGSRPGHARSKMLSVRLSPEEADAVQAAADAAGVPVSTIVRDLVVRGLQDRGTESASSVVEALSRDIERLRQLVS